MLPPSYRDLKYIVIAKQYIPEVISNTVNPIKLEIGLRPIIAGIPYALLFRTEVIVFPTFGLLL